ncbi:MAG: SGNH/GDSL hydrolase family protein [Verrucomicrobiia bacterium]
MAGLLVIATAIIAGVLPHLQPYGEALKPALVALGTVVFLLGALAETQWARRFSPLLCLVLIGSICTAACLEIAGRALEIDFKHAEANFRRLPPYYRLPIVATGPVFFRRPGPETWTGQAIRTFVKEMGCPDDLYKDEPVVTVHYDELGFRNEEKLQDWEIAVAGDSFTELGYLPYDQLFTSIMGRILNARVFNLGVSATGPLNQLHLLEQYGIAPSTRHTIIVFCEANDLEDLQAEESNVAVYKAIGRRVDRSLKPQTSFLRAICDKLLGESENAPRCDAAPDAFFVSGTNRIPVSLFSAPPGRKNLPDHVAATLAQFVSNYAEFGRKHGLTTWLAYMPVRERVLYGQLEFTERVIPVIRDWTPSDLPDFIAELCAANGVRFIDLTPALIRETTESRELTYNGLCETHLNARGSAAVAKEMAKHLSTFTSALPPTAKQEPQDRYSPR